MLRKLLREIHWPLVFAVAGLMVISTLFVYSASIHDEGSYSSRQPFWIMLGLIVLLTVPFLGYRTFLSVSYLLYALSLFFLLWVFVAGQTRLGAQRWLSIGPISIQPSEFSKLCTVLAISNFLGSHNPFEKKGSVVLIAILMALVPMGLIARQPDLGSSILFLPMIGALLFLWGIRYRLMIGTVLAGLAGAPLFWGLLKAYQRKRILVFLNPNLDPLGAGYTAIQSRIAVGSGGLFGKGYLAGTQSQLQFVPEHHTDFIYCVIGEEWGYLGTILLLLFYGFLFKAAFQVMENTTDMKAKFLIAGIVAIIFAQLFINIGMTFGLLPITGITLPLISYGGSSLITTCLALGLILSIYKERSIF